MRKSYLFIAIIIIIVIAISVASPDHVVNLWEKTNWKIVSAITGKNFPSRFPKSPREENGTLAFADGNGRVGRTLLNYFLMTHDHLPLIVHDDDKTAYYAALLRYDEDEEIDALYGFLRGQTAKTWEKTLARTSGK